MTLGNIGTVTGQITVEKGTVNYLSVAVVMVALIIISAYFLIKKLS